jgi:hypothetical protein
MLQASDKQCPNQPTNQPIKDTPGGGGISSSGFPEGLLRFWKAYPQRGRDNSSRPDCLSWWKKLSLESKTEVVLAALESWKRSAKWLKDGGQYIEGAHRWLKGRKFEELPSGQSPVGVNGAGRLHKPDESTKIKMIRASAIVDYFNRLEPTEQDVLLAEYRRLPGNEDASLFHRGFREWAFDQKKERAA